jgi:hypothetical protein
MLEKFILAIGDLGPLYLEPFLRTTVWSAIVDSQMLAGSIATAMAAFFANSYFKRKDYEAIQKRYIDRIEALIDYIHHISTTLESNHAHTLQIFKFFRDLDFDLFKEWYKNNTRKFIPLGPEIPFDFKIAINLFGNIKTAQLLMDVFIESAALNEKYITEIPIRINELINKPIDKVTDKEWRDQKAILIANELSTEWGKLVKKIKLYQIPEQLEEILIAARKMKLNTYRKLPRLKKDPEVMRAVEVMDRWFDESKSN